jgi:hypothetical protein
MTTETATIIQKEEISNLKFPKESVERTKDQISLLQHKLRRSMVLGNIHRVKMKITFEDVESVKEVRTTIWAVGDKNIVLKKGVTIPINRIIDIK